MKYLNLCKICLLVTVLLTFMSFDIHKHALRKRALDGIEKEYNYKYEYPYTSMQPGFLAMIRIYDITNTNGYVLKNEDIENVPVRVQHKYDRDSLLYNPVSDTIFILTYRLFIEPDLYLLCSKQDSIEVGALCPIRHNVDGKRRRGARPSKEEISFWKLVKQWDKAEIISQLSASDDKMDVHTRALGIKRIIIQYNKITEADTIGMFFLK